MRNDITVPRGRAMSWYFKEKLNFVYDFFHGKYIQLYSNFSKLLVYMCIDKACFAYLGNSISKKENPQN